MVRPEELQFVAYSPSRTQDWKFGCHNMGCRSMVVGKVEGRLEDNEVEDTLEDMVHMVEGKVEDRLVDMDGMVLERYHHILVQRNQHSHVYDSWMHGQQVEDSSVDDLQNSYCSYCMMVHTVCRLHDFEPSLFFVFAAPVEAGFLSHYLCFASLWGGGYFLSCISLDLLKNSALIQIQRRSIYNRLGNINYIHEFASTTVAEG